MANIFISGFWGMSTICMGLYMYTRKVIPKIKDANFNNFKRSYIIVYLIATASDWMQGPYIYALYEHYGISAHDIELLFVAGYGSSLIFGTVIGSFADKFGRRNNCILYAVLYGIACLTKHSSDFTTLFVGRLCSGVSTSILFSAFESWVVCEHYKHFYIETAAPFPGGMLVESRNALENKEMPTFINKLTECITAAQRRGFDETLLSNIFSHAVLGNSLVAIFSGIAAQLSVEQFGFVAPFDMAIILLFIMAMLICILWDENYGDPSAKSLHSFSTAIDMIKSDWKILYLGVIQSLFEGSMYIFVLEWTPALTPSEPEEYVTMEAVDNVHSISHNILTSSSGQQTETYHAAIPHGYVFASFMVAIMTGSSLFKIFMKYTDVEAFMRLASTLYGRLGRKRPNTFNEPVLLVAACSLAVPIFFHGNQLLVFISFLTFEICVGIFWPSLGTMRGKYIPEKSRATTMNLFRVPLNLLVVVILTQNFSMSVIFKCCIVFLLTATVCQHGLYRICSSAKCSPVASPNS